MGILSEQQNTKKKPGLSGNKYCGGCSMTLRHGCSYDVAQIECQVTGQAVGFYDLCSAMEKQKLIWLLQGKALDTPADVEHVADWLLSHGVSVL